MLTAGQKAAVAALAILALLVMALVVRFGRRPPLHLTLTAVAPAFDPNQAIQAAGALARNYPNRVTGTAAGQRAADYLAAQFSQLGYHVSGDMFTLWLAGKRVEGENVVAELPGDSGDSIAIVAHYDGQRTSAESAEDNASGVGVLLELARVLGPLPHRHGLIFVATDAEEWGMIGARALAGFLRSRQTLTVISIDYVNRGPARGLALDCEGQREGYTPLWLRDLLAGAAAAQHVPVRGPSAFEQWVERSIEVSAQDQGPLLRAGIPAINVSTQPVDEAGARARYHSPQDVFADFQPATFEMAGATIEQAVSALDQLPAVPPLEMGYLRFANGQWLSRQAVEWLQTIGLAPFMLACVLGVADLEKDRLAHPLWSYLRPGIYLLPGVAALLTLYGLRLAGILTRYELYPATPKDPFLYHIQGRVAASLLTALVVGYLLIGLLRLFWTPAPDSFAAAKRILTVWVYVLVVSALFLDAYAMWLLLAPLAYGFLLLQRPSGWGTRAFNAALLALAAAPFIALLYKFGQQIFLGWRILWYVVLQAAYRVWTPAGALVFILAVTLWIELLALGVFSKRRRIPWAVPTALP